MIKRTRTKAPAFGLKGCLARSEAAVKEAERHREAARSVLDGRVNEGHEWTAEGDSTAYRES